MRRFFRYDGDQQAGGRQRSAVEGHGVVEDLRRSVDGVAAGGAVERVASYVNSQPTTGGGTHELGFRDGLAAAVTAYAREQQLLTPSDPGFTPTQLGAGLTAVVSVKLDRPEFEGATRDWGSRGRRFKSCRPDRFRALVLDLWVGSCELASGQGGAVAAEAEHDEGDDGLGGAKAEA
ncbi:hypothetical protein ABZW30_21490, partial [Kitasatospora sp. NPDC004669]